jgi:putative addiction module component (TIGR02574 family)
MTKAAIAQAALELPVEDQLDLAQLLWDRTSPPSDSPLSSELLDLLDERRADALANPEAGLPWPEVKQRLLAR